MVNVVSGDLTLVPWILAVILCSPSLQSLSLLNSHVSLSDTVVPIN